MPGANRCHRLTRWGARQFAILQEAIWVRSLPFRKCDEWLREVPPAPPYDATVIILPVVRVERAAAAPSNTQDKSLEQLPNQSPSQTPKTPSGGKRRRRASRT